MNNPEYIQQIVYNNIDECLNKNLNQSDSYIIYDDIDHALDLSQSNLLEERIINYLKRNKLCYSFYCASEIALLPKDTHTFKPDQTGIRISDFEYQCFCEDKARRHYNDTIKKNLFEYYSFLHPNKASLEEKKNWIRKTILSIADNLYDITTFNNEN